MSGSKLCLAESLPLLFICCSSHQIGIELRTHIFQPVAFTSDLHTFSLQNYLIHTLSIISYIYNGLDIKPKKDKSNGLSNLNQFSSMVKS